MTRPDPELALMHQRLGAEIDRAIRTSDEIGAMTVSCHLQMARDMLDEFPPSHRVGASRDSTGVVPEQ
jgi:hypothetical protein